MAKTFSFDGEAISFESGDTIAAAILRSGRKSLRRTRFHGEERSIFCGIGQCFDCIVIVDGRSNQRACLLRAEDGIQVEHQEGAGQAQ